MTSIAVCGDDAGDFLQGQLTNDINRTAPDKPIWAAWCTPKGRVITLFRVYINETGYRLDTPADLATSIIARLTMYRFRAQVDFSTANSTTDIDLSERIAAGIPFIAAAQTEKFTPHMLNLDALGAINLDKGCYTGQEIVARTHYKGATKRRTLRFECAGAINPGDKVSAGSRAVGEVLNVAGNDLLAVISTANAQDQLTVNDAPLLYRELDYLPL